MMKCELHKAGTLYSQCGSRVAAIVALCNENALVSFPQQTSLFFRYLSLQVRSISLHYRYHLCVSAEHLAFAPHGKRHRSGIQPAHNMCVLREINNALSLSQAGPALPLLKAESVSSFGKLNQLDIGHRYFVPYKEETSDRFDTSSHDGYSLYRALARQIIGDPRKHATIRDMVLHFAIRARSNYQHPLHNQFRTNESAFRHKNSMEIFAVLDCPDLLADCNLIWVIAHALKVNLRVYDGVDAEGSPQKVLCESGNVYTTSCAVTKTESVSGMPTFSSLMADESCKELIEFLQVSKRVFSADAMLPREGCFFHGLHIREMRWAWQMDKANPDVPQRLQCNKDSTTDTPATSLPGQSPLNRFNAFFVNVTEPSQLRPALRLLQEALRRVPNQQREVLFSADCRKGKMLPQAAVGGNMVMIPRETANKMTPIQAENALRSGKIEQVLSVLSFAVGRHFFLMINPWYMLEHANDSTVPELEHFLKETIFNPELVKLWWNAQSDFRVLESTIAYMYQGSRNSAGHPRWHFTNRHLQGIRPQSMQLSNMKQECDLHLSDASNHDVEGLCGLGNVDLETLLNHFCRTHGCDTKHMPLNVRLLECFLQGDRFYPILKHFDDAPKASPLGSRGFYQSLGRPGMDADNAAVGHQIGYLAGLNLIFEMLLVSDDKELIASCLQTYSQGSAQSLPKRQRYQKLSPLTSSLNAVLIEDDPRLFEDKHLPWDLTKAFITNPCFWQTKNLSFYEHEERLRVRRLWNIDFSPKKPKYCYNQYALYNRPPGPYFNRAADDVRKVLQRLFDPTQFWFPTSMMDPQSQHQMYESPIVRAGTTHAEALLEFISTDACTRGSMPPPGFGVSVGHSDGLPAVLRRVPGAGLNLARNIFEAFKVRPPIDRCSLGPVVTLQRTTFIAPPPKPRNREWYFRHACRVELDSARSHQGTATDVGHIARVRFAQLVAEEIKVNERDGLPSLTDLQDVFDLEGREYRRRVEATPAWNRPVLPFVPMTHRDGSWLSINTFTLAALDDPLP